MTPTRKAAIAFAVAFLLLATACGRSANSSTSAAPSGSDLLNLPTTTTAGTQPVDKIVWGLYRETDSLDPIFAFDYPENTVLSLLCETLLKQAPDGSIGDGIASLETPNDTTLVFTLKDGVTFWDGNPVTPDDVVYSLDRAMDPKLGGFYTASFSRVKSIEATGSNQVTITLKQPDVWLQGELASTPGWIIEKAFAEDLVAKGGTYGSPEGGAMCSGSYKLGDWNPGDKLEVVRNDTYWDSSVHPLVQEIDFKGTPDEAGPHVGPAHRRRERLLRVLDLDARPAEVELGGHRDGRAGVELRRVHRVQFRRRPRRRPRAPGTVARTRPAGHHRPDLQGRGHPAAVPVRTGHVGLQPRRVPAGVGRPARADPGHREGEGPHPGRRRRGRDDHDRDVQRAEQPRGRVRRVPGRRSGHRAEGEAEVGLRGQLHQLLHRPGGSGRHRRILHRQLRRLTRTRRRCCRRWCCPTARRTTRATPTPRSPI